MSLRADAILGLIRNLSASLPVTMATAMASTCATTFVTMTTVVLAPIPPRPTPVWSCLSATMTIGASGGSIRIPISCSFGPIHRAAPSAWALALLWNCSPAILVLAVSAGSLMAPSSASVILPAACSLTFPKISSPRLSPDFVTADQTRNGHGPARPVLIRRQTAMSSLASSRRYASRQIRTSASESRAPAVARVCGWKAVWETAVTCRLGSAMGSSSVLMRIPTAAPDGKVDLDPMSF